MNRRSVLTLTATDLATPSATKLFARDHGSLVSFAGASSHTIGTAEIANGWIWCQQFDVTHGVPKLGQADGGRRSRRASGTAPIIHARTVCQPAPNPTRPAPNSRIAMAALPPFDTVQTTATV